MSKQALLGVLQSFGEIAHWTMTPDSDVGDLSCPPIVTWRYQRPSDEIAQFFRAVISTYQGTILWFFSDTRQTWSLMPLRVKQYAQAELIGALDAAERLMVTDPEFGKRANVEFSLFVNCMKRQSERKK